MSGKYTTAQARASKNYLEKMETITIRVPKGDKEIYKKMAEKLGKSLNQYAIECMKKGIE